MDLLDKVELDRWMRRVADVFVALIIWNIVLTVGLAALIVWVMLH